MHKTSCLLRKYPQTDTFPSWRSGTRSMVLRPYVSLALLPILRRQLVCLTRRPPNGITPLKYDRSTSTNFATYQKELEEVCGLEFRPLMTFTRTGRYPSMVRPLLKTVASSRVQELEAAELIDDDKILEAIN